ncbi:MAG: nitroreductase family protein [Aequoribacter sp.]|uniref:nitroreductase family protein n=1 Tax=Aequoribacter sp. TaxID=2847771 RepID=UPI003C615911
MTQWTQYNLGEEIPPPENLEPVLEFLSTRRSSLATNLQSPGPTQQELERMLTIAARVPDHRRLSPFRFIVIEGDKRNALGDLCLQVALQSNSELPEPLQHIERTRLLRAPTIIAVAYNPKNDGKTPEWEQTLACGACCYNLLLAAKASGFGAQWITEWLTYDSTIAGVLGLLDHERLAGFIYIGTNKEPLKERARPDLAKLITYL